MRVSIYGPPPPTTPAPVARFVDAVVRAVRFVGVVLSVCAGVLLLVGAMAVLKIHCDGLEAPPIERAPVGPAPPRAGAP